jgi:TolB protein
MIRNLRFAQIARTVAVALLAIVPIVALLLVSSAQEPAAPASEDADTRIYVCQPDGSGMKLLVAKTEYRMQGSPTWSADGNLIAFDAWRPGIDENFAASKVLLVNADGTGLKALGDGLMPSFSPRQKRIAFSRQEPNYGVWVMSSEGPDKELVLLDEEGWGAEWSPDGKQIVYAGTTGNAANLMVFDLVEGTKTSLFEGDSPYVSVFWNFCWSPDGKQIVFKGQRANGKLEIAVVDARGAKHGHTVRLEVDVPPNFQWSHDSKSVLFAQRTADRGNRLQLYSLEAASQAPPQLLAGQDPARANASGAISPDGMTMLMVSRKPPPGAGKAKAKKAD